ncbi:MAG TPA: hypothetical protein VGM05_31570 [Planctomycetaceae bacterium]
MSILLHLSVIVAAGSALVLALDVWNIRRELLPDIRKILLTVQRSYPIAGESVYSSIHNHRSQVLAAGYFAIWEWRNGEWTLNTGFMPPEMHPGSPPAYPGAFNGDKAKTWVSGL